MIVHVLNPFEPCLRDLALNGKPVVVLYAVLEKLLRAFDLAFFEAISRHEERPDDDAFLPLLGHHAVGGVGEAHPDYLLGFVKLT